MKRLVVKRARGVSNGTPVAPAFHEGPADVTRDVSVHRRFYTYRTKTCVVAGGINTVMFTLNWPVKAVWPVFRDFNLWQNAYGHYYSGVLGDLEGKMFAMGPKGNLGKPRYKMLRVIPQHLIVIQQPVPKDNSTHGISPGFHAFMLSEHGGKTTVMVTMEHASVAKPGDEDRVLSEWKAKAPELHRKWRDVFVQALKAAIRRSRRTGA